MMNVNHPTCIHAGCKKQPNYNTEGATKALYCSSHKLDGMINVNHPTCIHAGCKTRPVFNTEGETKGIYCSAHKLDEMFDVKNPTCIHAGCKTRPAFNNEGNMKALYCSAHKLDKMFDVRSQTCIHAGCKKRPAFNTEGATKVLYCSSHKFDGMINVKNRTCIHAGCKKQPNYNNEGNTKALYCSIHKLDEMVDVRHPTCKSSWCSTRVQAKYDGYCLHCYMHLFPDKPVSRNYKTKEYAVGEFVKTTFQGLSWIADKQISGGCSKKRPDLLLDLGFQILIIEVDENQHTDYDCSCENKRIMELSQDVGHTPIVFIRFNPDDYEENRTKISSCWGLDKNGICVIKKSKKCEWTQRLNTLKDQICYWTNPTNTTNKTIEIIHLFYDVN
jgi:hypothetical protein